MRTKVSLVVQDRAMIPQTELPVLELDDAQNESAVALIPRTVRFLRCGCPSVQWLVTTRHFSPYAQRPIRCNTETEVLDEVQGALSDLQTPGENFKVVAPTLWPLGSVITVSRVVTQKTRETTMGYIRCGEKFVVADDKFEFVWMRVEGQEDLDSHAVITSNERHEGKSVVGRVQYIAPTVPVRKLLE